MLLTEFICKGRYKRLLYFKIAFSPKYEDSETEKRCIQFIDLCPQLFLNSVRLGCSWPLKIISYRNSDFVTKHNPI